jgi:hypothetical protein
MKDTSGFFFIDHTIIVDEAADHKALKKSRKGLSLT